MARIKTCPNCTRVNAFDARQCADCGAPLDRVDIDELPPPASDQEQEPAGAILIQASLPEALTSRYTTLKEMPRRGAEGDLLLAECAEDRRQYVIKLYGPRHRPDPAVLERLTRASPDHVAGLHEYGEAEGKAYEVWEYLPLRSLQDLMLPGWKFEEVEVADILQELTDALSHIHELGVFHRDLKPANILLRQQGPFDLVLCDFGTAGRADETIVFTDGFRGTIGYAPPESLEGIVTEKYDFWSLGVIVYQLLTRELPRGSTVRGLTDLSALHGRWQQLCYWLIKPDYEKRWGRNEVRRWLAGDTSLPPPQTEAEVGPRLKTLFGQVYRTRETLAKALAEHWEESCKHLERGFVRTLITENLGDYDLMGFLSDLIDDEDLNSNGRLFRLITRMAPELPPTFMGYSVSEEGLRQLAQDIAHEGEESQAAHVVRELYGQSILAAYSELAGDAAWADLGGRWRRAVAEYEAVAERIADPMVTDGVLETTSGIVVSLLVALFPSGERALRNEAERVSTRKARACHWFAALGKPRDASVPALLLMGLLAPSAEAYTKARWRDILAERLVLIIPLATIGGILLWIGVRLGDWFETGSSWEGAGLVFAGLMVPLGPIGIARRVAAAVASYRVELDTIWDYVLNITFEESICVGALNAVFFGAIQVFILFVTLAVLGTVISLIMEPLGIRMTAGVFLVLTLVLWAAWGAVATVLSWRTFGLVAWRRRSSEAIVDAAAGTRETGGLTIASLACGIASLACAVVATGIWHVAALPFVGISGTLAIAAVITGHMALSRIKASRAGGRQLAVAGLIAGYISVTVLAFGIVLGLIMHYL